MDDDGRFPVIPMRAKDLEDGDYVRGEGVIKRVLPIGGKRDKPEAMILIIGEKTRLIPSEQRVWVHLEDNGID